MEHDKMKQQQKMFQIRPKRFFLEKPGILKCIKVRIKLNFNSPQEERLEDIFIVLPCLFLMNFLLLCSYEQTKRKSSPCLFTMNEF